MSFYPTPKKRGSGHITGKRGVALITTLAMVAIVSLMLVAFVTMMRLDRSATFSYSQSIKADQIGVGALQLIVGQLQNEMGKDAVPDLQWPNRPIYTNVNSANIMPQAVGTNSGIPILVKTSTNAPFYSGSLGEGPRASTVSSTVPSLNGRAVSITRWNQTYFGKFPNNGSAPYWMLMTRSGVTNGSGMSLVPTAPDSLNNGAPANSNFAIGRFAYAIYDEGGLLDITVAGHPTALTATQIASLKGTLAGANLTNLGIAGSDVDALIKWRNAATGVSTNIFINYITNVVATNGFSAVAAGDRTFLGRQDLIKAAQSGIAGLNVDMLTNLTTFTREKNAPSWAPRATVGLPTGNTVDYTTRALDKSPTGLGTNVFIPLAVHKTPGTITRYKLDSTATTYDVVPGDPLVRRKFPLDRLKWVGPNGPQNGGTAAAIKDCFGLEWLASGDPNLTANIWKYTAVDANGRILKLTAITGREPNFFELLQAGILSGSLATELHTSLGAAASTFNYLLDHNKALTLHVLRIGASILSQYDPTAQPIVVEYLQSGSSWQAAGIDNLPYISAFTVIGGRDTATAIAPYMVFSLTNPHLGTVTVPRPPVRLRLKGSITIGNGYGNYPPGSAVVYLWPIRGYQVILDSTVELSTAAGVGVNGFTDPHVMLPADLASGPSAGSPTGMAWASLPNIGGVQYAGFRLPNFEVDIARKSVDGMGNDLPLGNSTDLAKTILCWTSIWAWVNTDPINPFNFWLEYKNSAGKWIPYSYNAGINDSATTWFSKSPGFGLEYLGPCNDPANPTTKTIVPWPLQPIDAPSSVSALGSNSIFYFYKQIWEASDSRSLRFNSTQHQPSVSTPVWADFLKTSMWSSQLEVAKRVYGRTGSQNVQKFFGGPWVPSGLVRNNNPAFAASSATSYAAYSDRDGVRRIADSGLYPMATTLASGNPYELSTNRTADRPIILNRPFTSVGELGYVFRDYPWRTLDFFTAESADGGLLDIFTVDGDESDVVRGRINLNTQNAAALGAVMNDAFTVPIDVAPFPVLTTTDRRFANSAGIASKLIVLTKQGTGTPLAGRDQIPTKLVSSLTAADFATLDESNIKGRREAITRSLADVGQTRTWNLMVDIVAQSGRLAPNATGLDQFVVDGEKRFWLHLAIDRYTGEIVEQQLEPVTQ